MATQPKYTAIDNFEPGNSDDETKTAHDPDDPLTKTLRKPINRTNLIETEETKYQDELETQPNNLLLPICPCFVIQSSYNPPKFTEPYEGSETVYFILIKIHIGSANYKMCRFPCLQIDGHEAAMINVEPQKDAVFVHRLLCFDLNKKDESINKGKQGRPTNIHLHIFDFDTIKKEPIDIFNFDIKYNDINWINDTVTNVAARKRFESVYKEKDIVCTIYEEQIQIYGTCTKETHKETFHFPTEEQCVIFSGRLDKKEWIDAYDKGLERDIFLCEKERNMQIYYDKKQNIVYGVPNDVIADSMVFGGDDYVSDMKNGKQLLYLYLQRKSGRSSYNNLMAIYDIDNITEAIWISSRYHWIQTQCLYGQDSEFNIFRSLCFVRADEPVVSRLSIGLIVLVLQLFLTVGIVMEVVKNWNSDDMFDNDVMIVSISFLVFTIISFMFSFTVQKYFQFYDNMRYVSEIPSFIMILDFISNLFIGFIICIFSFFYLLQSETITDVVLNSFALTFIIELDDMANLYESDENKLLEADWSNIRGGNYDDSIRKIRILDNGLHVILTICSTLALMCIAPLGIVIALGSMLKRLCTKKEKQLYHIIGEKSKNNT